MGKLFTLGVSVACAMVVFSCSKEADTVDAAPQSESLSGPTLNITVNSGEIYTVSFPKESELNIHKQASHFRESATVINNETGQFIYKYAPAEGFAGNDEVILGSVQKVDSYRSGCYMGSYGNEQNQMLQKTYTTVKIKVNK